MSGLLQQVLQESLQYFEPPPKLTISEWADEYRKLSGEASAEQGQWRTERAEFQRGIMDAISDPLIHTVVLMSSAQCGKSEILLNTLGYFIHFDPSPILFLQPTVDAAEGFSKERIFPMLRDTPELKQLTLDGKGNQRDTILQKRFTGGQLTLVGANSATGLSSRPIRILLCDETDRYPYTAKIDGDPLRLAMKRTSTYWNRKIVLVSTPTVKGVSVIERWFEESDQRFYFVKCPHCQHEQTLQWNLIRWTGDGSDAKLHCEKCETEWTEGDRIRAVRAGSWKAKRNCNGIAGFRLNALYSPWTRLSEMAQEFLQCQNSAQQLQTFVNLSLGETWEDQGETIDEHGLYNRREVYKAPAPAEVLVITAGVDVQDDRLEVTFLGTGKDNEGFILDHQILHSDPAAPQTWLQLDKLLKERWRCADGHELPVQAACIDSGGHYTQAVYEFVRSRTASRIYAIKGVGGEGKPPIGRPSRNNSGRIKLFPVGVDTIKQAIFGRLRIASGPEALRFPKHLDEEYFAQLTAEKIVTKYHKGFPRREWIKIRPRNEALDCLVYSLAALSSLNIRDWKRLQRSVKIIETIDESVAQPEPQPQRRTLKSARRPQSWIQRF